VKTGASPASEPSVEDRTGALEVSCPPNALCPLTIGCAPPLLPPRPISPRLPRPPLLELEAGVGAGVDSGATEAGRSAREAFAAWGAGLGAVAFPAAPPRFPPRPRRFLGGLFRPTGGGAASTADMTWV
jgi:hypothetical protein